MEGGQATCADGTVRIAGGEHLHEHRHRRHVPANGLSTPAGKRLCFWAEWTEGPGWERTEVTADDVPLISEEFLEDERRLLRPHVYSQKYRCVFFDAESQFLDTELIKAALTDQVAPLWEAA
jgi:hypothetical protein